MSQPAQTYASGSYGALQLSFSGSGGPEVNCTSWTATMTQGKTDVQNSTSGPFAVAVNTKYQRVSGTFELDRNYAAGQSPFGAAPSTSPWSAGGSSGSIMTIFPGLYITTGTFYEDQTAQDALNGPAWIGGNIRIDTVAVGTNIQSGASNKVRVTWSISGPNGSWSAPTT